MSVNESPGDGERHATKRLLIVNNVPTPYRTFMFTRMNEMGRERGIDVSIFFQAASESRRPWKPDQFDMSFPYRISTGMIPWRRQPLEFFNYRTVNSDLAYAALFEDYDWVLFAPFMSVGNWLLALLPLGRTRKLLWSESNMLSTRHVRGPARWWKRTLLDRFAVLACPGQKAVDYVCHFHPGMARRPLLWLPNIVDTSVFDRQVRKERARRHAIREELMIDDDTTLVVGVGQMTKKKGFHRVIEAAAEVPGAYTIILLGDGPLHREWRERVEQLGISGRIRLPGQADTTTVVRHLAAADWFLHSALFDPSPLVVIEASVAGLPLAVSTQTGNSPEAVDDDHNGFTFDPTSPDSMKRALQRIAATPRDELELFGARSAEIARERFDPDTVLDRFFEGLLATK